MSLDVFDPNSHKIIAVDRDGSHIHVTLHELALDAQGLEIPTVDLTPILRRLERIEHGAAPAPASDRYADLEARIARIEAYIQEREESRIDDMVGELRAMLKSLVREASKAA